MVGIVDQDHVLPDPDGIADEAAQKLPVLNLARQDGSIIGVFAGFADRQVLGPEHGGAGAGLDPGAVEGNQGAVVGLENDFIGSFFHPPVDQVGGAQEIGDETVVRVVVKLYRRADLLNDAVVQHRDAVRNGVGLFLVVGDEDGGEF